MKQPSLAYQIKRLQRLVDALPDNAGYITISHADADNILAALKEADAIQEAERTKANLSEAGRAFFGGRTVL